MKFYGEINNIYFFTKIKNNSLTAIYYIDYIKFFKNGRYHNTKNASYINKTSKAFDLNWKCYGDEKDFTKKSWRKFIKLKTFL